MALSEGLISPKAAPHAVLDPVAFPRVQARDQDSNLRVDFAKFYPNGLPNVYRMLDNDDNHSSVATDYVEEGLDMSFYTDPPRHCLAIYSTLKGKQPFRTMSHILPQRRLHLWSADEIQRVCNSVRQANWESMKHMKQPFSWNCLYKYFDSWDIYHYGALNLWNIVNQLYYENSIIQADVAQAFALEIGHWADEWLRDDANKARLTGWDEAQGPIFHMLKEKEDLDRLGNLQDEDIPLIAKVLKDRRSDLLRGHTGHSPPPARDLMSAKSNHEVENWLVGQPVLGQSGLPEQVPNSKPFHDPSSSNSSTCHKDAEACYFVQPQSLTVVAAGTATDPNKAVLELRQAVFDQPPGHGYQQEPSNRTASASAKTAHTAGGTQVTHNYSTSQGSLDTQNVVANVNAEKPLSAKGQRSGHCRDNSNSSASTIKQAPTTPREHAKQHFVHCETHENASNHQSSNASKTAFGTIDNAPKSTPTIVSTDPQRFTKATPSKIHNANGKQPSLRKPSQGKENIPPANGEFGGPNFSYQPHGGPLYQAPYVISSSFPQGFRHPHPTNTGPPGGESALSFQQRQPLLNQTPKRNQRKDGGDQGYSTRYDHAQGTEPTPFQGQLQYPSPSHGHNKSRRWSVNHQSRRVSSASDNVFGTPPHPNHVHDTKHRGMTTQTAPPQFYGQPSLPMASQVYPPDLWRIDHPEPLVGRPPFFGSPQYFPGYNQGPVYQQNHRRSESCATQHSGAALHAPTPGENRQLSDCAASGAYKGTVKCNNQGPSSKDNYQPCGCPRCEARNRTVCVKVHGPSGSSYHTFDIQACLKKGIGARYGEVETAIPIGNRERTMYLVRFLHEISVLPALKDAKVSILENNFMAHISPAQQSKWVTWDCQQNLSVGIGHGKSRAPPTIGTLEKSDHTHGTTQRMSHNARESNQLGVGARIMPHHRTAFARTSQFPSQPPFEKSFKPKESMPAMSDTPAVTSAPPKPINTHQREVLSNTLPGKCPIQEVGDQDLAQTRSPAQDLIKSRPQDNAAVLTTLASDENLPRISLARVSLPPGPQNNEQRVAEAMDTSSSKTLQEEGRVTAGSVPPLISVVPISTSSATVHSLEGVQSGSIDDQNCQKRLQSQGQRDKGKQEPTTSDSSRMTDAIIQPSTHVPKSGPKQAGNLTETEVLARKRAWNRIPLPLNPWKARNASAPKISSAPQLRNTDEESLVAGSMPHSGTESLELTPSVSPSLPPSINVSLPLARGEGFETQDCLAKVGVDEGEPSEDLVAKSTNTTLHISCHELSAGNASLTNGNKAEVSETAKGPQSRVSSASGNLDANAPTAKPKNKSKKAKKGSNKLTEKMDVAADKKTLALSKNEAAITLAQHCDDPGNSTYVQSDHVHGVGERDPQTVEASSDTAEAGLVPMAGSAPIKSGTDRIGNYQSGLWNETHKDDSMVGYRLGAGGSLRMPKKRKPKSILTKQWLSGDEAVHDASHMSLKHSSSTTKDQIASTPVHTADEYAAEVEDAEQKGSGLNPLAIAFVSPTKSAAGRMANPSPRVNLQRDDLPPRMTECSNPVNTRIDRSPVLISSDTIPSSTKSDFTGNQKVHGDRRKGPNTTEKPRSFKSKGKPGQSKEKKQWKAAARKTEENQTPQFEPNKFRPEDYEWPSLPGPERQAKSAHAPANWGSS